MTRRTLVTLGILLGGCSLALARPATAADAPPASAPANPALEDGGAKLAIDDTQGAIRRLRDAVRAAPNDPKACCLLATAYLRARQHEQAAETAETLLKQPGLTHSQRGVASLLLGKACYSGFLDDYGKVTSQMGTLPNMAQLLSQMATHKYPTSQGDIIITTGDVNAQDDFETIKTTFKDTMTRLQHRLDRADTAFKDALVSAPRLAGIHDGLGLIRAAQGYLGEARREYLTELTQHGPSGPVYLHLGELDFVEGHNDDAVENLRRAATMSPQMETPYRDLIAVYAKTHDAEHLQWAKGMDALRRGDLAAAESALTNPAPKTSDLLCGQAQLRLTQKHTDDARTLLARATALDGHNAQAVLMRADLEEAAGRYDQAVALYHQALDLDVACDAAWYGLGIVYDHQNNLESAIADYAQALQANPNNPLARLNLAADEADSGQSAKAVADLQDYEERFPTANNIYSVDAALVQLTAKQSRN